VTTSTEASGLASPVAPRVLIADDDPSVLKFLADHCAQLGFRVQTASNGLNAFAIAHRFAPDVLIIDVNMPEVNGMSLCEKLLEPGKKPIDLVVISGNPTAETVERCEGYGASCVPKGPELWDTIQSELVEMFPGVTPKPAAVELAVGGARVSQRPRVLICDDDADVGNFLCSRLNKCGVDALFAPDGVAGYRIARSERPAVVISDYYMPTGDALYLLWKLRSAPITDSIPVFVMSGRNLDEASKVNLQREICGRPGAARLFRKPLDFDEMLIALKKYCALDLGKLSQPTVTRS
jgi:CheY-like chemotaxis protein